MEVRGCFGEEEGGAYLEAKVEFWLSGWSFNEE